MLWLKSFHIIFVVTWFAGLFYLPRLFVYHAMAEDAVGRERFKIMERKLFHGIMTPSAVLVLISGVWLLVLNWPAYVQQWWIFVKLFLLVPLFLYHIQCGRLLVRFAADQNTHTHVWYRWFNEVPTVLLLAIVFLAVIKPW